MDFEPVTNAISKIKDQRIKLKGFRRLVATDFSPMMTTHLTQYRNNHEEDSNPEESDAILRIMHLASAHVTSQALRAFAELNIANAISSNPERPTKLEEISKQLGPTTNEDALLRTLKLLESAGIVVESDHPQPKNSSMPHDATETDPGTANDVPSDTYFTLTKAGMLLRSPEDVAEDLGESTKQIGMRSCVQHWTEKPLWDAGHYLPEYILGNTESYVEKDDPSSSSSSTHQESKHNIFPDLKHPKDAFTMANGGQSSDVYYNQQEHPESLQLANNFVKFVSDLEVKAVVDGLDWSRYQNKTILDIGGYNGRLLRAIAEKHPNARYKCLDLPDVILSLSSSLVDNSQVELIGGNIFDVSTLPTNSNVIIMKHFLDRCMWTEEETIQILQTCHDILHKPDGQVILAEAVIPDPNNRKQPLKPRNLTSRVALFLDALYMLVGRERQRTESEWEVLAERSGFRVKEMVDTGVPSCFLIILEKK